MKKDGSGVRMSMSATGAQAHSERRDGQQGKPRSDSGGVKAARVDYRKRSKLASQ